MLGVDSTPPILHATHVRADPDTFAGVYWGWKIFGGCVLVHSPRKSVSNLMDYLNFKPASCDTPTTVIAYDTNRLEDLPVKGDRLILVDHHPWMDPDLERLAWKVMRRPRSCLAMNLYDMSVETGIEIPDDVLLSFALALLTDTAVLRTAGSEEMEYMSKFLAGRKMEEILEIAFKGVVDVRSFLRDVSNLRTTEGDIKLCFSDFESDENFLYFVDTLMYVLGCDVAVGKLEWGVWVYTKKSMIQKIYPILKEFERFGYRRRGGRIFGFSDLDLLIERISGIS